MGGPVVFQVAERLAGAWAERFTGVVRIRGTEPAIGRPLRLSQGGLVDPKDVSIVDIAVRGAQLQFVAETADPGAEGDRLSFIQMLWAAVYSPPKTALRRSVRLRHWRSDKKTFCPTCWISWGRDSANPQGI